MLLAFPLVRRLEVGSATAGRELVGNPELDYFMLNRAYVLFRPKHSGPGIRHPLESRKQSADVLRSLIDAFELMLLFTGEQLLKIKLKQV